MCYCETGLFLFVAWHKITSIRILAVMLEDLFEIAAA